MNDRVRIALQAFDALTEAGATPRDALAAILADLDALQHQHPFQWAADYLQQHPELRGRAARQLTDPAAYTPLTIR